MRFSGNVIRTWTALLSFALLGTTVHAQAHTRRGYLFIVGGGPQSDAMVQRVVDLYDARHAKLTPPGAPVLGESGLILSVLPAGSSYYPVTGKVVLPR